MFQHDLAALAAPLVLARVESQERDAYLILPAGAGEPVRARIAGALRHAASDALALPVVGDYVAVVTSADAAVIERVVGRRNVFVRRAAGGVSALQPIAANVDTLLIAASLEDGDVNLRRLERYLAAARRCDVAAAIVLTKADLANDAAAALAAAAALDPDVPPVALSAATGAGLGALERFRGADRTLALVGASGAGKSTLINALAGAELLDTGAVRASDGRGRHTTTRRQIVHLPDGTAIVDTPGMREFGLAPGDHAIASAFGDVEDLAARCRFRDCRHEAEPGCAVVAQLDPDRLASFRKLVREEAFEASKSDAALRREQNRKWRLLASAARHRPRRGEW